MIKKENVSKCGKFIIIIIMGGNLVYFGFW